MKGLTYPYFGSYSTVAECGQYPGFKEFQDSAVIHGYKNGSPLN